MRGEVDPGLEKNGVTLKNKTKAKFYNVERVNSHFYFLSLSLFFFLLIQRLNIILILQ